jgi:hypothetical protein
VPYKEKLEKKILCSYCLRWFHAWLHKQTFDENNIRKLLKKYDFYVEKIEYYTFIEFLNFVLFFRHFLNFVFTHISKRSDMDDGIINKK